MNSFLKEDEFNRSLGWRLMTLRQKHKMSQSQLGAYLGVRYQQIQKYESGRTRMTAEKIAACAEVFNVPVGYFFGNLDHALKQNLTKEVIALSVDITGLPGDIPRAMVHLTRAIERTIRKMSNDNQEGKTDSE